MITNINVRSSKRTDFIDITKEIQKVLTDNNVQSGLCYIFVPHTTAAVTINEGADPSVKHDIVSYLNKLVPLHGGYAHMEGNSDAHIKSSILGNSVTLIVEEGKLMLGTWQAIFFCEFDGPRHRRVAVKIIG